MRGSLGGPATFDQIHERRGRRFDVVVAHQPVRGVRRERSRRGAGARLRQARAHTVKQLELDAERGQPRDRAGGGQRVAVGSAHHLHERRAGALDADPARQLIRQAAHEQGALHHAHAFETLPTVGNDEGGGMIGRSGAILAVLVSMVTTGACQRPPVSTSDGAGAGGGAGGSGPPPCASIESRSVTALLPDVLIVLDASGSMNNTTDDTVCSGGCGASSKWAQLTPALDALVAANESTVQLGPQDVRGHRRPVRRLQRDRGPGGADERERRSPRRSPRARARTAAW